MAAGPPRHGDPVAQAFTRIITEGTLDSPDSIHVYGNVAMLSESGSSKVMIDLVSARMRPFHFPFSWQDADNLINHCLCERAAFGNVRSPDVPLENLDSLRDFIPQTSEESGIEVVRHDEFYFLIHKTLTKVKANFCEGVAEFGLPPGFVRIYNTALATVQTDTPAGIRDIIVFCGGGGKQDHGWGPMPFDTVHIFDIDRERFDRWPTLPDPIHGFPVPNARCPVVVANKWLFVFGGSAGAGVVWRLEIASSRWQHVFQLPNLWFARSAAYCQLSGRLLVLMSDVDGHRRMEMFRVTVPSLAWMSLSKVLSCLKPEALAAVHVRFGFGIPGPSIDLVDATDRIREILYADWAR